jgi:hypothetical protein
MSMVDQILDMAADAAILHGAVTVRFAYALCMIIAMSLPRPQELDDEQWLRERYVERKMTATEIGNDLGCAHLTVVNALRRHGIEIRLRRFSQLTDERWLRERYVNDVMAVQEIADSIGASKQAVLHAMKRFGIERRGKGETQRLMAWRSLPDESRRRIADPEWMRTMYGERSLSSIQIASILDCTDNLVIGALRHHRIPVRSSPWENKRALHRMDREVARKLDDPEWLRNAYVHEQRSSVDIASELGHSQSVVFDALRRHGISTRSLSEALVVHANAARNGYDVQRKRRLQNLAKDAGDVGRAYTSVIKILGQLNRVPFSNRETARLEKEAMDGLYRAQDALAQRLLLGQGD